MKRSFNYYNTITCISSNITTPCKIKLLNYYKMKTSLSSSIITTRSHKQVRSLHSFVVATGTTSTCTSYRWCRSRSGKVRCFGAFLVGVSRIFALGAYLPLRSSFSLIHVVPDPLLLAMTNTLTHGWIWIWYVQHTVFGVLSESSKMQLTLNSVVPSVYNGLLKKVFRHVAAPMLTLCCKACSDHI
jgi:hypothetical protein